ncbi:MAG: DUF58 domain-containing protein [Planctomycetota bacterium]
MPITRIDSPYLPPDVLDRIRGLELYARQVVEGMRVGKHRSRLRGNSTDFMQHRQYVAGDAIRHIDWRVYGRTSRYHLKLYQAETEFAASLLLDASTSMHYGSGEWTKLEYAKRLAACLAYAIVSQNDAAGLAVFDASLRCHVPPKASNAVIRTIAEELSQCEPRERTDVANILNQYGARLRRRSYVILISDLFDGTDDFLKGLNKLRAAGHNVLVLQLLDPHELDFPFTGTCRFEGLEGEEPILLQTEKVRENYLQELQHFLDHISQHCTSTGIDYLLVDTSKPLPDVLEQVLSRRGR